MNPGKMRHRIILQKPAPGSNSFSDDDYTFVNVCTRWASVRPATAREIDAGQGKVGQTDVVIELRWDRKTAAAKSDWQVTFQNIVYEMISPPINVDFQNRQLKLLCRRQD